MTDLELLAQRVKGTVGAWDRIARMGNVLRYYRPGQLARRGLRLLRPALVARKPRRLGEPVAVRGAALGAFRKIAETRTSRNPATGNEQRDDLARGRFTLLSQQRDLGWPIDWRGLGDPPPSRLWSFQLHYHEYLLDLAASSPAKDPDNWQVMWEVIASWIAGNPPEDSTKGDARHPSDGRHPSDASHPRDAWHPYCVSRRLPVWAQLYSRCEVPQELAAEFLTSFATQAEWLGSMLEFDLGGNHLLENLRALALAGCFIEGPRAEGWLDLAERHLRNELASQILPTGEHYERSPMYHCQVLGNLLQVGIAARGVRAELSEMCLATAEKMSCFLEAIIHPDGELPLWGDSCFGEVYPVAEIRALEKVASETLPVARPLLAVGLGTGRSAHPTCDLISTAVPPGNRVGEQDASGIARVTGNYWVWREGADALLFDAGPVGADSLPAHAHCDLLGFEASVAGRRWFVDSGVFDYADGTMRDYCRSSLSHNVVTINNQNCCDIWSRFRMGRRGRITRFEQGQQGRFAWCLASHDGYRGHGITQMSRLLVAQPGGVWACVENASPSESAGAIQAGELVGRLHLAPELRVEVSGPQQLKLRLHETIRWLRFPEGTKVGQAEGWYCDRFGKRTRTQVITYQPSDGSTLFGWWLEPSEEGDSELVFPGSPSDRVQFTVAEEVFEWEISC